MNKFRKVAVGISGGVDSAVTALLLKQKGFEVEGIFMQNWDIADETGYCSANADYSDAQTLCNILKIKLHRVNFVKEYWNEVFSNLVKDYQNGLTPNPDILCNRNIKFNYFYDYAKENINADAIATGHYAKTSFGSYLENYQPSQGCRLLQAKDLVKDQTFFLCQIKQRALRKTMFPLSEYYKSEVKEIANKNGLGMFVKKKESMGICFIGSRNFQKFINEYINAKCGKFYDIDNGKIVGEHKGIHQWTLGQRSRIAAVPDAYYIAKKNTENNAIYVAQGSNHPIIYSKLFFTSVPHWIYEEPEELKKGELMFCEFKFQHTHSCVPAVLYSSKKGLIVSIAEVKRAITPGQYAVFYQNGECLGSARIVNSPVSEFSLSYLLNKSNNLTKTNSAERCDENVQLNSLGLKA